MKHAIKKMVRAYFKNCALAYTGTRHMNDAAAYIRF